MFLLLPAVSRRAIGSSIDYNEIMNFPTRRCTHPLPQTSRLLTMFQPLGLPAIRCIWPLLLTAALSATATASDEARLLLSDRCNLCHGPDATSREADLRLDTPEGLFGEANNGGREVVVAPGKPAESQLMRRILSDDPSERMPPPESNLALTDAEIAVLEKWIATGADWESHWSFRPIVAKPPAVISIDHPAGPAPEPDHPVDRFITRRIVEQQLEPTPEADRATLLRRLSFDLTGLPPTPEELADFLADTAPDAYTRQVDRLLASPRFGERMAVPWLDAARYADTYGYQSDVYREMWPWRDWVIEAFNRSMPYDQFLVNQIAGDLIEQTTRESTLATAFNRHHRQTNEGGSIEAEFQVEYVADRVNTLGTAILGLTLECARCHDHKYDPISQRDYYQFFAFFNNIDESGLYSHFTKAVPTPTLWLPTESQAQQLADANGKLDEAIEAREQIEQETEQRFSNWLATHESPPAIEPDLVGHYTFDTADQNNVPNAVPDTAQGALKTGAALVPDDRTSSGQQLALTGEDSFTTPIGGKWTRDDPWTIAAWIKVTQPHERAVVWHRSRAWTDAGSRGFELLIEDDRWSAALIHFWPGNAMRIVAEQPLEQNRWTHVTVRYDGSSSADGLSLFVDGQPVATTVVRDQLDRTINGGGANELTVGARFRDRGFAGGHVDELRLYERDLSALEIAALVDPQAIATAWETARQDAAPQETEAAKRLLRDWYRSAVDEASRTAAAAVQSARETRSRVVATVREIMVMEEMPERRPTFLLSRGQYNAPADPVQPNTPAALPPMAEGLPANRLGLAQWLVDDRNPLTARVAANRVWTHVMGTGLVSTAEDFGSQGQPPTHPELLDWLAAELQHHGWDIKRLTRLIVTSDAYRRSSVAAAAAREQDPENLWYARGRSRRLSVEMIRDSGLLAAGLLADRVGGPPVKPYQPAGLWKEKSAGAYKREPGANSHRRSMYTIWKRTSPPPSMLLFDAPDREVCVAKRQLTQTPLQALVLLNDEQAVESARGCAARVLRETAEVTANRDAALLDRLCLILLGRPADERERSVLLSLLEQQRETFAQQTTAAEEFLAVGDFRAAEDVSPNELAAVTIIAQAIMNYAPCVRQN